MQSELKPCPFCGSGGMIAATLDDTFRPMCEKDRCCYLDSAATKAEAIAAWNARASDAEITRLTEALRKIAAGQFDGIEVTHWSARECREIARQALAGAKP